MDENHIMENIIYNELRIRGFHVDVGVVEQFGRNGDLKTTRRQLEIDFMATKGSEKYYIQSAFAMASPEKQDQEERPLRVVGDSLRKNIIVRDNINPRRKETEITTMGVRSFLLDENSLYI